MKVEILQSDIDQGLTRSYTLGSVSRAIKRAVQKRFGRTPSFQILIPSQDYVFINGRIFDLPPEVGVFIKLQDGEKTVKPLTFELPDLPDNFFEMEHSHA